MPVLGTLQLSGCNYQIAYDLISQSTANNTSTVSIYGILNVTNNYVSWSSGTASVHTASAGLSTRYNRGSYVVVQRNFTFTHNNDGNLTVTLGYSLNTTYTSGSGGVNLTLPQIKRFATITDTPSSLNDEQDPYITFTNPANATNLNAWLEVNPVGTHYAERAIDITSGTYTWELTNEERDQLRAVIPNSNTGTIRLGLYSTQSGTTGATYKDIPFSIVNATPYIPRPTMTEQNTNITNNQLTENDNAKTISGYSNKKFTITTSNKGQAQKGATLVKYRITMGDLSVDIPYSDTETVDGTIYNVISGNEAIIEAIDSRGNVGKGGIIIPRGTIPYSPISFNKDNCTLERDDGQVGENAILTLNGYIWNKDFGNKTNEIRTLTYRLKKTDSEAWITGTTTITPTLNGNSFTYSGAIASDNQDGTWDLDDSYNVEITIEDYLSTATISFILNSATPTLSLDKKGVGIMCAYDSSKGGLLQVGGKVIGEEKYSTTEEIEIGTWINGKKLYRKTFELHPSSGGEITFSNVLTHSGIAMFDKSHTFLLRSNGTIMTGIGNNGNSGYWFDARSIASNGSLMFFVGQSIYSDSTLYATVIYTKD